jgi:pre-mRNA-processing factor 8
LDAPLTSSSDIYLGLLGTVNEIDDSESEDDSTQPQQTVRLQTGHSSYGALSKEEQDHLLKQITGQTQTSTGLHSLLPALRELSAPKQSEVGSNDVESEHIPSLFLKNSRSVRLAVLAGLIDSNGWYVYSENVFGFSQNEQSDSTLFWDTVALARSLGLSVCTKQRMVWNSTRTEQHPQPFAEISGNLKEIPCLLIVSRSRTLH